MEGKADSEEKKKDLKWVKIEGESIGSVQVTASQNLLNEECITQK